MSTQQKPHVLWDSGTAYDLFASLHVLHHPDRFGLRGSWAAGVRSRLTTSQRTILEEAQALLFSSPNAWVANLPQPKDAAAVLWALGQIKPAAILFTLASQAKESLEILECLNEVSDRRAWNNSDLERLQLLQQPKDGSQPPERLVTTLNWWSHPDEFGEGYLAALQAYVTNFFAEEERRIKPYLEKALAIAQELAGQLDFSRLMVELSQGVKIVTLEQADEVVFVPSYWITPLVTYDCVVDNRWVVLFGARPAEVALVPGEVVPDAMIRTLKALSDPTRLLILRYLSEKSLTPAQLARILRLRAPTVIHHLSALRLAGLLYVSLDAEGEKHYAVRETAVKDTFEALYNFYR
jgi:DNA-binding transcriptional ArsR family regulator